MTDEFFINTHDGQIGLFSEADEYNAFVEKFKTKLTTDDCYTPELVYDAVADWVAKEYGLDRDCFLRPFWPGADYRATEYPDGCVVVDNPPYSIRSQIVEYYVAQGVHFFLFSPALALLTRRQICHIAVGVPVTYANGAEVATSFVTNLEPCVLRTAPTLYAAVTVANAENLREGKKSLPKYEYPDEVVTAAIAQRWCKYGVDYRLDASDAISIPALDEQRAVGKVIFGSGYLLAPRAAAERAAAARVTRWQLSERERSISRALEQPKERA